MSRAIKFMFGSLALVFCTQILAFDSYYECTIERYSMASGDSGKTYYFHNNLYIGEKFTVERDTGYMSGALKNSYLTTPQVVDIGSPENSYKVVTTMKREQGAGAGSNIYALNINEYETGTQKSFVFVNNDEVFFGKCMAF